MVKNYFAGNIAAGLYAESRPPFHSNTLSRVKNFLQINHKFKNALDVACGTGLSTRALTALAKNVWGTDISPEMLQFAQHDKNIHYAIAPAEKQPFPNAFFDLVTVSSGVHWFNIDNFLFEANRVLNSQGWLVIYENHFIAEMKGNENFANWYQNNYIKKFPSPPRNNNYDWSGYNLACKGFRLLKEDKFKNELLLNKSQLIKYFITQTNIIAAVENSAMSFDEIKSWLNDELSAFFADDTSAYSIYYGNWIKYLKKTM